MDTKYIIGEIKNPKYWLHLGIIAVIVLWLLQILNIASNMLTIKNVLLSVPLLAVADLFADYIMGLK